MAANPTPPVQGVIFDLDGTLYTARFLGLTIAAGFPFELLRLRKIFRVRKRLRSQEFPDADARNTAFAKALAQEIGLNTEDAVDWYNTRFMKRFTHAISLRGNRRPGLKALLKRLKERGVKLGVVSDFGWVEKRLIAIDLSPGMFDDIRSAESFGVMKPHPTPYLQLAAAWQLPIESVLLVGDRADHDRPCAIKSGAQFIGIAGGKKAGADFLPWSDVISKIDAVTSKKN